MFRDISSLLGFIRLGWCFLRSSGSSQLTISVRSDTTKRVPYQYCASSHTPYHLTQYFLRYQSRWTPCPLHPYWPHPWLWQVKRRPRASLEPSRIATSVFGGFKVGVGDHVVPIQLGRFEILDDGGGSKLQVVGSDVFEARMILLIAVFWSCPLKVALPLVETKVPEESAEIPI